MDRNLAENWKKWESGIIFQSCFDSGTIRITNIKNTETKKMKSILIFGLILCLKINIRITRLQKFVCSR